ncbi:hypothetical protein HanRHA438_Chr17g0803241 [Helianthus annuus]|nr:hypothetical protein HanRHA438_Chr17g0803241 [Helianthus annuus]
MGVALKGPGGAPDPPNFSLSSVMSGDFLPPGRKSQASPLPPSWLTTSVRPPVAHHQSIRCHFKLRQLPINFVWHVVNLISYFG